MPMKRKPHEIAGVANGNIIRAVELLVRTKILLW